MRKRDIASFLLAAASAGSGAAAQVPDLDVGDRLRMRFEECPTLQRYRCGARLEGSVVSAVAGSVLLEYGAPDPGVIQIAELSELERSLGRRSAFRRGAVIGGLAGGVGATFLGLLLIEEPGPCGGIGAICFGKGFMVTVVAMNGIFWGGLIGGLVGWDVGREVWESVPLVTPRVGIAAGHLDLSFEIVPWGKGPRR